MKGLIIVFIKRGLLIYFINQFPYRYGFIPSARYIIPEQEKNKRAYNRYIPNYLRPYVAVVLGNGYKAKTYNRDYSDYKENPGFP